MERKTWKKIEENHKVIEQLLESSISTTNKMN